MEDSDYEAPQSPTFPDVDEEIFFRMHSIHSLLPRMVNPPSPNDSQEEDPDEEVIIRSSLHDLTREEIQALVANVPTPPPNIPSPTLSGYSTPAPDSPSTSPALTESP